MTSNQLISRRRMIQVAAAGSAMIVGSMLPGENAHAEREGGRGKRKKRKKRKPKGNDRKKEGNKQAAAKYKEKVDDVHDLEYEHFKPLVGDEFEIDGSPYDDTQHQGTLTLVDVQNHVNQDEPPPHTRTDAFSLLFVARNGTEFADGTHWMEHPKLFRMAIYLHETTHADHPHEKTYVAVFN